MMAGGQPRSRRGYFRGWCTRGYLGGSWFQRSSTQHTKALFGEAQIVMWACEGVADLAAKSVADDATAVVFDTLPTILCSLVGCLLAVEAYCVSGAFLGDALGGPSPPPELEGKQLVRVHPRAVACAIERAIYRITTTFRRELLSSFRCVREWASVEGRREGAGGGMGDARGKRRGGGWWVHGVRRGGVVSEVGREGRERQGTAITGRERLGHARVGQRTHVKRQVLL